MKYDQKILIIRFSSIGDIVLSTSPLNTIRKKYPNSEITYLTLTEYSSLLEMHPYIDILMTINRSTKLSQLFNYNKFLKSKNYTIIFDLHNNIRSRLITFNFNCKIIRLKSLVLIDFYCFSSISTGSKIASRFQECIIIA